MIHRIMDLSVRNKFLVMLLVGAAAVAGAWSLQRVPLDARPSSTGIPSGATKFAS